jgi:L-threonylcarbamoyladenylate synthase
LSGRVIQVDRWNPDPAVMAEGGRILRSGGLVAFPTETVYGLGANALDDRAVREIYRAKGRPSDNPLIVHVQDPREVISLACVDARAERLMDLFWPGPLTLVMPAKDSVPSVTRGGLDTVAVRMPSHPVALALIAASGVPVAAPSANRSGRPSPTEAATVARDLGEAVGLVIDGGGTDVGLESTVLDVSGKLPLLLRPGGLGLEVLEDALGRIGLPEGTLEVRRSPGTRYRHYAPSVPVLLWPEGAPWPVAEKHGTVGYMGLRRPGGSVAVDILFDSPEHYARGLFSGLRHLETTGISLIVADFPAPRGIGLALRDRLSRAAGLR